MTWTLLRRARSIGTSAALARGLSTAGFLVCAAGAAAGDETFGDLYVGSRDVNAALRYDGTNGDLIGPFVAVTNPRGVVFGPNGNLFVASYVGNSVLQFDGDTGALIGAFASGGGLFGPHECTFRANGNLLVSSSSTHQVVEFDGQSGAPLGVFASGGGLGLPTGLAFGPNGNLFVSSFNSDQVIQYDGQSGALIGTFAAGGGLNGSTGLVFGPNGNLFVCSFFSDAVIQFNGQTGAALGTFATAGGLDAPYDVVFGAGGHLFVSSSGTDTVIEYDGSSGALIGTFATQTGDPTYLTFRTFSQSFPAPNPTGMKPGQAANCAPLLGVTISGTGLVNGVTAELVHAGRAAILGAITALTPDTSLTVTFDISGAAPGAWDLVLSYPDGQSATLAGALLITACPLLAGATLTPVQSNNCGTLTATVNGSSGFATPVTVKLRRMGFADIPGAIVSLSDTSIVVNFDVAEAAPGAWDVVVLTPAQQGLLPLPITVCQPGRAGDLYVTESFKVKQFDGVTGQFVVNFVVDTSPLGMTWLPNGNLAVGRASVDGGWVQEFDGQTGALLGNLVALGAGGLDNPRALVIGPNGNLFVADIGANRILEYDATTGAFIGAFVDSPVPGSCFGSLICSPTDLGFGGPSNNLFVASSFGIGNHLTEFDGTTGDFVRTLPNPPNNGSGAYRLDFSPDGHLVVRFLQGDALAEYELLNGTYLGSFVGPPDIDEPIELVFGTPYLDLFVQECVNSQACFIKRFDGAAPHEPFGVLATGISEGGIATMVFKPHYGPFPAPEVTGIFPDNTTVCSLATQTVTITGDNLLTNFAEVRLQGAGHPDVLARRVVAGVEPTSLVVEFNLLGAAAGLWDVVVGYPDGPSATLPSAFENTVTLCPPPQITDFSPPKADNCFPLTAAQITGENFHFGATAKLARRGEPDIVGTNLFVASDTSLVANFDIGQVAPGAWSVVVTNPDDQTATLADVPQIEPCQVVLTGFDDDEVLNCAPLSNALIEGFGFLPGLTIKLARLGLPDVVGTNVQVTWTTIHADFDVTTALSGTWDLVVANPTGDTAALLNALTILSCPEPTGVVPATAENCAVLPGVTITGTGFEPGATAELTFDDLVIPGTNVQVVSATTMMVDFDLSGALPAVWSACVTNPDGQKGCTPMTVVECNTVLLACPYAPTCPPDATPLAGDCGGSSSAGCSASGVGFLPISCGDTVCKSTGTYIDGNTDYRDLDWYEFELAASAFVTATLTATFNGGVAIQRHGDVACDSLIDLAVGYVSACGQPAVATTTECLQAGSYWIIVFPDGFGDDWPCPVNYTLSLSCAGGCTAPMAPVNDDCADALPVTNGSTAFNNVYATTDGPDDCPNMTLDLWYTYQATCTGLVKVELCNIQANFDTTLAVYHGTSCNPPGEQAACDDDACGPGAGSRVTFPALQGESFLIRVGGWSFGPFSIGSGVMSITCHTVASGACCVPDSTCQQTNQLGCAASGGVYHAGESCPAACAVPRNDECEDAIPQPLPTLFLGNNVGATDECGGGIFDPTQPAVWEAFFIEEYMDVTIDFCLTNPTFFNVYVVLFQDCCVPDWIYTYQWSPHNCVPNDGNFTLHFPALPPGTYYYPVLTEPGATGNYAIQVTGTPYPPPPRNDLCQDATPITDGVHVVTNAGARTDGWDGDDPCSGFGFATWSDVWYSYTANCYGDLILTFQQTDFASRLYVYDATEGCPTAGIYVQPLSCYEPLPVEPGQELLFRLGGQFGDWGTATVEVACTPRFGACCAADGSCTDAFEAECDPACAAFFANRSCLEGLCPQPDACAAALYANPESDDVNGLSHLSLPGNHRSILADFVLSESTFLSRFASEILWPTPSAVALGYDLAVYANDGGAPGNLIATLNTNSVEGAANGQLLFGMPVYELAVTFDPIVLPVGTYWLEMHVVTPGGAFQPTAPLTNGSGVWVNYEQVGGLQSGADVFGADYDVTFCLGASACFDPGDVDGDLAISLSDYAALPGCLDGPTANVSAACLCFDWDHDARVDIVDLGAFQKAFTGASGCLQGTCCLGSGTCALLSEVACGGAGGSFQGSGTACDAAACPFGEYLNHIDPVTNYVATGTALALADDLTLAGTQRDMVYLELAVGATDGGPFDVTVSLYSDCPGNGGTLIPGATFTWTDIPGVPYLYYILTVDPLDPPVTLPDTVWMVVQLSQPLAGWMLAEQAEIGFTANLFGANDPPWTCAYVLPGEMPYAGFWARLRCTDDTEDAATGSPSPGAGSLHVTAVPVSAPLTPIDPAHFVGAAAIGSGAASPALPVSGSPGSAVAPRERRSPNGRRELPSRASALFDPRHLRKERAVPTAGPKVKAQSVERGMRDARPRE